MLNVFLLQIVVLSSLLEENAANIQLYLTNRSQFTVIKPFPSENSTNIQDIIGTGTTGKPVTY